MPKFSPSSAASRGKSFASKVTGSKVGKSMGAFASKNPKSSAAMGLAGAAGLGGMMKKRGPGVSKKFANGRRTTSMYKY